MTTLDDTLENWADVERSGSYRAVLLGNGFSISKAKCFDYRTLHAEAVGLGALGHQSQDLFSYRSTTNFEEVLQLLADADYVDRLLGSTRASEIRALTDEVRKALTTTIIEVHPEHGRLGRNRLERIAEQLRAFSMVFTTNYDLIPYWALTERGVDDYYDYFWSSGAFDKEDTEVYLGRSNHTAVVYLHGAIHLLRSAGGVEHKLVAGTSGSVSPLGVEPLAFRRSL